MFPKFPIDLTITALLQEYAGDKQAATAFFLDLNTLISSSDSHRQRLLWCCIMPVARALMDYQDWHSRFSAQALLDFVTPRLHIYETMKALRTDELDPEIEYMLGLVAWFANDHPQPVGDGPDDAKTASLAS